MFTAHSRYISCRMLSDSIIHRHLVVAVKLDSVTKRVSDKHSLLPYADLLVFYPILYLKSAPPMLQDAKTNQPRERKNAIRPGRWGSYHSWRKKELRSAQGGGMDGKESSSLSKSSISSIKL